MSLPSAEGEVRHKTAWMEEDEGMVAWPGMGRNPLGIQPVWPKTHPPW